MSDNLSFDPETNVLKVKHVDGVEYRIGGRVLQGKETLKKTTTVKARPKPGYVFPKGSKTEWTFEVSSDPVEDISDDDSDDEVEADPVPDQSVGNTPENPQQQVSGFSVGRHSDV